MSGIKQRRVAEQVRQNLSDIFLFEISDPRLQGLTVTEVRVDREISHATAFVAALGDDERQGEVLASLEKASAFLRREVAQRINVRSMPQLHFVWDPTLENGQKMDNLLDSLEIPEAEAGEESAETPPVLPEVDTRDEIERLLDDL